MFRKNCVFSQFTATHPLNTGDQLILVRNLSVQSLLFFSHFPNGAERGGCKILKILGKNIIFSEHPVPEKFMSLEYLRRSFDNSLPPPPVQKKGRSTAECIHLLHSQRIYPTFVFQDKFYWKHMLQQHTSYI